MTEASMTVAPVVEAQPKPPTNSIFRHAVYVIADNPVTGLSFGLFVLIALCALFGPTIVPYDPLASDTSATLQSPSLRHWFGTDLLGRDIFSRVLAATRLDFTIAIASVALVLVMGTAAATIANADAALYAAKRAGRDTYVLANTVLPEQRSPIVTPLARSEAGGASGGTTSPRTSVGG